MDSHTDEQLVDIYRETGEEHAFELLVRRYTGKVRAMVYPMVLNDMDADDVTQDVFVRAAKGIAGFKKRARFSTWIYRIAMNNAKSFLKKNNRNPVVADFDPPEQVDASPEPGEAMITAEISNAVESALASLTPPLRAAITLTAINGLTPAEAAKAEGCMTATIYWRIHEARRILRDKLNYENANR